MLRRAGLLRPTRPDRMLAAGLALARWGLTPASAYGVAAARWPDRLAVVDERERLSYAELDRRTNAVAHGLSALGVQDGGTVALLARNSAAFVVAEVAVAGVPDDTYGARLVAYVVRNSEVSADELRAHASMRLATYQVPRGIVFRDALPRNETGKVLKRLLVGGAG